VNTCLHILHIYRGRYKHVGMSIYINVFIALVTSGVVATVRIVQLLFSTHHFTKLFQDIIQQRWTNGRSTIYFEQNFSEKAFKRTSDEIT
jgi:hypothetical protein